MHINCCNRLLNAEHTYSSTAPSYGQSLSPTKGRLGTTFWSTSNLTMATATIWAPIIAFWIVMIVICVVTSSVGRSVHLTKMCIMFAVGNVSHVRGSVSSIWVKAILPLKRCPANKSSSSFSFQKREIANLRKAFYS